MMKEWLATAATVVLSLCALVVTGLVVHERFLTRGPGDHAFLVTQGIPATVPEWRDYGAEGHVIGASTAAVTLVTFSDFECPACRIFASYLPELLRRFEGDLAVVYRHFPMPSHAFAVSAAKAAECAAEQGKFGQFHDAVFAEQDSLPSWSLRQYAKLAEVEDLNLFDECRTGGAPMVALDRDIAAGNHLGVTGTPTLLINGRRLNGVPPIEVLAQHITEELRASTR